MRTRKNGSIKKSKPAQYVPLTVGAAEKRFGVKYNAPSNQSLVTYLKQHAAKPLGDLLQEVEQQLVK